MTGLCPAFNDTISQDLSRVSEPTNHHLIHKIDHPLVEHHLRVVRDAQTPSREFRVAIQRLSVLVGVYATADLAIEPVTVRTPLADAECGQLAVGVGLVPILRAGLGMVDPLQELLPDAAVWHLGLYRNEQTAQPVGYYDKLPTQGAPSVALVLDPMLATGGSVEMVVERLTRWGVNEIRVLSIIAARAGLDRVTRDFPDVRIFVAAIDPELNDQSFIVPGLGDAGDRIFDTPQHG